jgi:hypothetical protein
MRKMTYTPFLYIAHRQEEFEDEDEDEEEDFDEEDVSRSSDSALTCLGR